MKQIYTLVYPYRKWLGTVFMLVFCVVTASAQVKGVVFRDFDANGIRSDTLPVEGGVADIIVLAFVEHSATPISTTTDADGKYVFSATDIPAGKLARLEFINFPTGNYNGPYGANSGTSMQFVKSPTDKADLGINYPADYCQRTDIHLVTPCFVNGNAQLTTDRDGNPVPDDKQTARADALVSFPYAASGVAGASNFMPTHLASAGEVGAIWGLAYQRRTKKIFSGAVIKRHTSLGPGGSGGIYITDMASGHTSLFMSVSTVGIDMGDDPHTNPLANLFGDKTQASTDALSMTAVGRMSFGGMELSEDDKTLYFINLKDRSLYSLTVGSPAVAPTSATAVKAWAIPNPGCSNGDFRPWALKMYHGKLYIGVVCSAETSQQPQDLKATIYRVDPTASTPVFDEVLSFPLDFQRGPADLTGTCTQYDHWLPWTDAWPTPCGLGDKPNFVMYPQPIVVDLEFDADGAMLIGFADRFGHQSGIANHDPAGNGLYDGFTAGDLLRANNQNGVFELESNGKSGQLTGSGANNHEGPGGGEFFGKDNWFFIDHIAHSEIITGSLSLVPGMNEVFTSAYDPIANIYQSGGLKVYNTRTGVDNRGYVLYSAAPGSFGKASGLGDNKVLCDPAAISIGNRVWFDDNRNGIQDAYEPGIDGIVLTLHDMENGGAELARQTTHDGGQFYFTNETVTGGLLYNHQYEIRMDTTQLQLLDISVRGTSPIAPAGGRVAARGGRQAASGSVRHYFLSPANRSTSANPDLRDSDAMLVGNAAVITVTTLDAGQNDFTNDLSIYSCPELTNEKDIITSCPGTKIESLGSVGTNLSEVDSVRFVVFSSPQSGTAMYDNTGIVLGTVKADANNRAVLPNPAINTTNTTASVSRQYVYAIIYPTPENPACRQSDETIIEITPGLAGTATGGTLTCSDNEVTLTAQAIYSDGSAASTATYAWTGPGSFTSSTQNPVVSLAGTYTVVFSTTDCPTNSASATAVVTTDNTLPVLEASGAVIPCKGCSVTLTASAPGATLQWTGPNGFTSTVAQPEVTVAGDYTVVATSVNGCTIALSVEAAPTPCPSLSVSATGSTVTCSVTAVTLTAQASLTTGTAIANAIYSWTGPNGFTSSEQMPVVSQAGTYTVTTYTQDCPDILATTTAEVITNTTQPILEAYGAAIPCNGCSATLFADAAGATLFWTGPNGFTSTAAEPEVTLAGDYTVVATGVNGCTIDRSVEVLPIVDDPCPAVSVTAVGGTMTCSVTAVTLTAQTTLIDGSVPTNVVYSWIGPNGFTSSEQSPSVSIPGNYTVTTYVLDCPDTKATAEATITTDTAKPVLVAHGATIPCTGCSATLSASAPGATLLWAGPNGFVSTETEPKVTIPGTYTVTTTGTNGCQATLSVDLVAPPDPCKNQRCLPILISRIR